MIKEQSGASPNESTATPAEEYQRRLADRRLRVVWAGRRDNWIANGRLLVFIAAAVLLGLSVGVGAILWTWLLLPVGGYVALALFHARILQEKARAKRSVAFYDDGLARLGTDWVGRGISGEDFADSHHPFGLDLDLFGTGSVFERLCRARTRAGEAALADWLREPASPSVIRERQAAVEELRERLDLREDLAILGEDIRAALEPDVLTRWASAPAVLQGSAVPALSVLFSLASLCTLAGWIFLGLGPWPFVVAVALQWVFHFRLRPRVEQVVGTVERPRRELAVLAAVLGRLEAESFASPQLKRLQEALDKRGEPASARIASLGRLVDLLGARHNQLFIPIAFILGWSLHLAHAVERWRARSGARVGAWLAAVGDLEALSSLSAYAYERPGDPFPTIVEDAPLFEAEALAHPLLKSAVANDVALGGGAPVVLLVSGSNMSGKSTLLRTVGVNTVLALAGAPVCARALRLSPLSCGATLRLQDSLQEGASRFYAEITRIKQILDLTSGPRPVLFLLDEVLHGTNSHDRRIGAEAVVRGLMERGAIGLVTTHDLALAKTAEVEAKRIRNVHFEDFIEEGKIRFDYRMRPGVVEKSNALELMRAVGLEV